MRKQDQLLNLIKSLTPAEKKYFSQFTATRSDSKSYMALYTELQKADTYDADILSKKTKKSKQNLAHEKDHLQSVLLKSLRNYEGDKHVETRLHNALTNMRLLNHKGQYQMALAIGQTAQKEAEQYERWDILWALIKAESTILNGTDIPRPERIKMQDANSDRMDYATSQMDLISRFEKLHVKMDYVFQQRLSIRSNSEIKVVQDLLNDPLMTATYEHIIPQRRQAIMYSSIYVYLAEFEKALPYYKKILDLTDKYPEHIEFTLREYFVVLSLYMSMLSLNGKYDEAYEFIETLKKKSLAHIHYNTRTSSQLVIQYTILQELMLGKKTNNREKGLAAVARLKANYKVYMAIPSLSERTSGLINAAKICFSMGLIEEAIYWIEKVFNDTEPSSQIECHNIGRLMFAICHAELKNYTLLPYLARSAERFLKKNNGYMEVEKMTMTFLKKLPTYRDDKERKAGFKKLLADYQVLEADKSKPGSFRYFNYIGWAKANAGVEQILT